MMVAERGKLRVNQTMQMEPPKQNPMLYGRNSVSKNLPVGLPLEIAVKILRLFTGKFVVYLSGKASENARPSRKKTHSQ